MTTNHLKPSTRRPFPRLFLASILFVTFFGACTDATAQRALKDSVKLIELPEAKLDTTGNRRESGAEDAPLDIGQDRGLFIVTADKKLQLRILGSVRYLVVLDGFNLADKAAFKTTQIPTGSDNQFFPVYHNDLLQSRLGFEATRRTEAGDIFIRLETDFNGPNGFQIRHAYGEYQNFIVGQTWSLFTNLNALPATVDLDGPLGSIAFRTPQMRYTTTDLIPNTRTSFALEFPEHQFRLPDSSNLTAVQFLPDPSVRFERSYSWGDVQTSLIIPILAGRYVEDGSLEFQIGWGLLAAAEIPVTPQGRVMGQVSFGRAITGFYGPLDGRGRDVIIRTDTAGVPIDHYAPITFAAYASYVHTWEQWLTSSISAGLLTLESRAWVPGGQYQWGYTFTGNTFWDVTEGARIGVEGALGERIDVNAQRGFAYRASALFYYDF